MAKKMVTVDLDMHGNDILNPGLVEGCVPVHYNPDEDEFARVDGLYDAEYDERYYLPGSLAAEHDDPGEANILATEDSARYMATGSGAFLKINANKSIPATSRATIVELSVDTTGFTVSLPSSNVSAGRRFLFYTPSSAAGTGSVTIGCLNKGVNDVAAGSISTSAMLTMPKGKACMVWYNGTTWLYVELQ